MTGSESVVSGSMGAVLVESPSLASETSAWRRTRGALVAEGFDEEVRSEAVESCAAVGQGAQRVLPHGRVLRQLCEEGSGPLSRRLREGPHRGDSSLQWQVTGLATRQGLERAGEARVEAAQELTLCGEPESVAVG